MSSKFDELVISPGLRVDPITGEILEEFWDTTKEWKVRSWSYVPPRYSQEAIDTARETTSVLCEQVLSRITRWRRVKRGNNRGHDIVLKDWRKLEAKVWRIGNAAVVKQNQLFDFDANFWGFLFYRTLANYPPSFFTSQNMNIAPSTNLLRNIDIDSVFIFPTNAMRFFWNSTSVKKWVISTSGIAHKPFALSRAENLFMNSKVPGRRNRESYNYGRHSFEVKSIDLDF
jgi:hypothetical protein